MADIDCEDICRIVVSKLHEEARLSFEPLDHVAVLSALARVDFVDHDAPHFEGDCSVCGYPQPCLC